MKNLFIKIALLFSVFLSNAQNNTSFFPDAGKYIVSGWVKEINANNIQKSNYISYIKVNHLGVATVFYPSGQVIDGWQRIVGIVDLPEEDPNAQTLPVFEIELICDVTATEAYFDDIRFFPYNGNLKSFVYAEDTQRLMAELDENNYATFYEYDLEGGLVRVKKETENGVMTIQETRSNTIKKE